MSCPITDDRLLFVGKTEKLQAKTLCTLVAHHRRGPHRSAHVRKKELDPYRFAQKQLSCNDNSHSALADLEGTSANIVRDAGTQNGEIQRHGQLVPRDASLRFSWRRKCRACSGIHGRVFPCRKRLETDQHLGPALPFLGTTAMRSISQRSVVHDRGATLRP